MDLIYMNEAKEDVGVLHDYILDMAFGKDENDFECQIVLGNHCCKEGYYLYSEGTEYGGIIDDIYVDTDKDELTYHGRTWHGILDSKVIEPDAGEDYLILSGDANEVLGTLISRLGLGELFVASTDASGITISNYKMNRYIAGYQGIRKMLKSFGGKLNIRFKNGMVELSAVPFLDYSKDEQFDTDQIEFVVKKKYHPINHVICLGQGDLAEREVIHLYTDSEGNLSHTQSLTGISEVTAIYENVNAGTSEELEQGGMELILESWESNEISFDFNSNDETYDIGDIVGAKEYVTGIEVNAEITKKIVTINNNSTTISYKVGE